MEDAITAALNTIERQIRKSMAEDTPSLQQRVENLELVQAGMTLVAFALGRLDVIANSLEDIASSVK